MEQIHDVVVIGGGAAGLSAALVLGRARRRVAVVDAGAPRNAPAAHMQGFLSRDGMSPADLLAAGRAEVTGYGVEPGRGSGGGGRGRVRRSPRRRPGAGGATAPRCDRCQRRAAGDPRCPRALGPGSLALPVLPRVGGPRRADRGSGHCARLGRACATGAAVVRRRGLLRPHLRPDLRRTRPAGGTRDSGRRR